MTATISTRLATSIDSADIAAIHSEGIRNRIATFATEPRNASQVAAQLADKGDHFPTIVAERGGRIVGFATASSYRSSPWYAGIAEHSVYVVSDARGSGVGLALLDALVNAYERRGFWKLLSRIFPENRASLVLHQKAGFQVVGTYRRHSKLDGVWRDCVIVERLLGEAARN